jgi:hypothetical protein
MQIVSVLRLLLLAAAIALVAWAYRGERTVVARFDGGAASELSGREYVEGLTTDSYLRANEAIFDIYSNKSESVQIRDCHT